MQFLRYVFLKLQMYDKCFIDIDLNAKLPGIIKVKVYAKIYSGYRAKIPSYECKIILNVDTYLKSSIVFRMCSN